MITTKNFFEKRNYKLQDFILPIANLVSISVSSCGILNINNNIGRNSKQQSFFDLKLFYSSMENRYIVTCKTCKSYTLTELSNIQNKLKCDYEYIISFLELNKNDFESTYDSKINQYKLIPKSNIKYFCCIKNKTKIYSVLNYIIID